MLHVACGGGLGDAKFMSALYGRLDTENGVWLGAPEVLQQATSDADQYGVWDLAVADDGTVVVMALARKAPPQPPWRGGWSSALLVRRPDEDAWRGPFAVNVSDFGVWGNLQILGETVHSSYRTGNRYIAYRSFSLRSLQFEQEQDVTISEPPASGNLVSNASSLVVDPLGGRTILYPVAGARPELGQLRIAHAPRGGTWRTQTITSDARLPFGDIAHEHFALVRGPGVQVIALYSKACEDHRVLYRRILEHGRTMEPERELARSPRNGTFARIAPMRDSRVLTRMWAAVAGEREGLTLGVRAVLAAGSFPTRWALPSR